MKYLGYANNWIETPTAVKQAMAEGCDITERKIDAHTSVFICEEWGFHFKFKSQTS